MIVWLSIRVILSCLASVRAFALNSESVTMMPALPGRSSRRRVPANVGISSTPTTAEVHRLHCAIRRSPLGVRPRSILLSGLSGLSGRPDS